MFKVLVLYYSRTGNTEKMANAIAQVLKAAENIQVELNYFVGAEDLNRFEALLIGAPTYHHDIPIDIKMLFEEAAARKIILKGKIGATFGSYGWSGEAPKLVLEIMKYKFDMNTIEAPLLAKYSPDPNTIEQCKTFGKRLAEKLIQ